MRTYTLTNDDYYKAEIAIYNDLPSAILYRVPESRIKKPSNGFKRHLLEGEEYKELSFIKGAEEAVVTNLGRVFNTVTGKQLMPLFNLTSFSVQFRNTNIRSIPVYKTLGWEHDIKELWDRYREYGWRAKKTRTCQSTGFI